MTKARLFQYAVIWNPTEEEEKNGKKSELVLPIRSVLATDEKNVKILASREIPEEYINNIEQIDIIVRPF